MVVAVLKNNGGSETIQPGYRVLHIHIPYVVSCIIIFPPLQILATGVVHLVARQNLQLRRTKVYVNENGGRYVPRVVLAIGADG